MKIAKRDKQILMIFAGIVLAFVSFYLVFLPAKERTEALLTENAKLVIRVTELEQLAGQKEQFETQIQTMTDHINEIYEGYQTDFRAEDAFMLGRTVEEQADNTLLTAINIANQEVVYDPLAQQEEEAAAADTTDETTAASEETAAADAELIRPVLYKKEVSLTQNCTDQGLKDIIDYITRNTNKMTIESLSVSYDMTTGLLNGNTVINVYLLQGTNKPYVPWTIPSVVTGTDNVFGTLVLPSDVPAEDTESTDESTEEETENADDSTEEEAADQADGEAETDADTEA